MSVRIADLAAKIKRMTVRIGGEPINFAYKPGVITQSFLNDPRPLTKSILDVLVEWDLEFNKDELVPLDDESMKSVPFEIINLIWKKIVLDVTNPHEDDEKKD